MKKKLLTLFALALLTVNGYSQAEAYDAPDIFQCGNEVFNFTTQTPYILGNQDPDNFSVAYFESEVDAAYNTNPIADPTFYMTEEGDVVDIFARVTNNTDNSFDITAFLIGYGSTWVPELNDVTVCNEYILPTLQQGYYYTGLGGTGTMLMPGDAITTSQTIYIFYQAIPEDSTCVGESSFEVTIEELEVNFPVAIYVQCDESMMGISTFNLAYYVSWMYENQDMPSENFSITVHETEESAMQGTNAIPESQLYAYTNIIAYEQEVYFRVELVNGGCFEVVDLTLAAPGCEDYSILSGNVYFDADNNGCDENDIPAAGLSVVCDTAENTYYASVNSNGEYAFNNVSSASSTVAMLPDPYVSFIPSPLYYSIELPTVLNDVDFCLQSETDVNDMLVWLMPTSAAMPGMEASYVLVYANYGTQASSGTISLNFDDASLTYNTATPAMQQSGSTLALAYSDLQPFSVNYIFIHFTVMQPPTVNLGDILEFEAVINTQVDDNIANNTYELSQLVSNSYDPNDITVREGASITPAQAEDYLHYTIRFQNEGTANAQTVRIETQLDANLDWNTFMPMQASHSYEITRDEQGAVEFIFNNIDLPFTDADETGSQGYITYKIKPLSTVGLGDSMSATAGIYFDFNEAVMTNTATTTVEEPTAGSQQIDSNTFVIYPNPANENITLRMQNLTSTGKVTVTDVLGKTVLTSTVSGNESNLNVSALHSGIYFVTVEAEGKSITKKIVIE